MTANRCFAKRIRSDGSDGSDELKPEQRIIRTNANMMIRVYEPFSRELPNRNVPPYPPWQLMLIVTESETGGIGMAESTAQTVGV